MNRRFLPAGLALGMLAFSALPATLPAAPLPAARPAIWATAVSGTSVENLYLVDSGLYRSAQPATAGFRDLAGLGVKAILSVSGGDDSTALGNTGLKAFHVPMTAWSLRDDRVLQALKIMTDPANRPLLIHCQHGADRTGAMVALYRVVVQGWSKEDAIREMNEGGFHHSSLWRNLDRYVLAANVEALRQKLGIAPPVAPPLRDAPVVAAATPATADPIAAAAVSAVITAPAPAAAAPTANQ